MPYKGSQEPRGYKGDRGPQPPPAKKRRKRFQVRPTRAMLRYILNQQIGIAFVDICRELSEQNKVMTPETFEKIMLVAKRRATNVSSEQQDARYDKLAYKVVNELRRTADKREPMPENPFQSGPPSESS